MDTFVIYSLSGRVNLNFEKDLSKLKRELLSLEIPFLEGESNKNLAKPFKVPYIDN